MARVSLSSSEARLQVGVASSGSGAETGPRCSFPGGGEAGSDEEDVAASTVTTGVSKEDWSTKSEATTPEHTMVISVLLPSSAEV